MEADWSIAMGADDPVIVVPWGEDAGGPRFVDLRAAPDRLDAIAEAQRNPPLRAALLALNRPGSRLWTAKCDAWTISVDDGDDPLDPYEMDAAPGDTGFGAGSYIDLLPHEGLWFASFDQAHTWMRGVVDALRAAPAPAARVELTLRHALVDGHPGFGHTCMVEGCGATAEAARQRWAEALHLTVDTLRNDTMAETGE